MLSLYASAIGIDSNTSSIADLVHRLSLCGYIFRGGGKSPDATRLLSVDSEILKILQTSLAEKSCSMMSPCVG